MNPEFIIRMRVAVLAIFLAGMPVLALPQVNDWLGQRLFGDAATESAASKSAASKFAASRQVAGGPADTAPNDTAPINAAPLRSTQAPSSDSHSVPFRSTTSRAAPIGSRSASDAESSVAESSIADSPIGDSSIEAAQVVPAAAVERLPPAEFEVAGAKYGRLQARLRELGADYWRLETTGAGASAFRFECHLPLPGHDSYSRPFAAESPDPLDAMQRVVAQVEKQVEKWQAAQNARRAGGAVRR